MKKMIKRRMALLLVLALCLSMMSITVFATNEDGEDTDKVDSMGAEVIVDVKEIDDCTEDEAAVDGIMELADVPAVSVDEDDPVAEETSEVPMDEPEPESTGIVPLAAVVASGECGEDLTWTLDDDGTLTISGTGDMSREQKASWPWYSYSEAITTVVIEDGVTNIGANAFDTAYTNLSQVIISDSVTDIGGTAFCGCTALTQITIPDSVTNIGGHAFCMCKSLEEITIGSSVERIGGNAFKGCTSLKQLDLPASLTSIGTNSLGTVSAFRWTDNLEAINVDPDNQYFCSVDGVLYSKDLTELIQYPANKSGETYIVGNGVTSLVYGTFRNATNLVTVVIPESVVYLEGGFEGCSNLSQVVFLGDAPDDDPDTVYSNNNVFGAVSAYYPADNETWTTEAMETIGTDKTIWIPYTLSNYGTDVEASDGLQVSADIPLSDLLTLDDLASGDVIDFILHVADANDTVPEEDVAEILAAVGDVDYVYYLDISLAKSVNGTETEIAESAAEITITIAIPDEMAEAIGDASGTYCVVRLHDGEAEVLDTAYDAESGTLTFSTDKFSTYGIVFLADGEDTDDAENTDDTEGTEDAKGTDNTESTDDAEGTDDVEGANDAEGTDDTNAGNDTVDTSGDTGDDASAESGNDSNTTGTNNSPKTGDESMLLMFLALLMASGAALFILSLRNRKVRR